MMAAPSMRAGQTVYLACGTWVEPVTYLRSMNGRCLVACGNEESDLRWQLDAPMEPEYAPETHCQSWRYSPMDAPGDGWAGR